MLETPVAGIIGYSTDSTVIKRKNKHGRKVKPIENPNPFQVAMMETGVDERWISLAYQGITPTRKAFREYTGVTLNGHAAILCKGIKRPSMAGLLNMVFHGGKVGAMFMNIALKEGGEAFIRSMPIKSGRKPSNNINSLDRDIPYVTSKGWVFVNDLGNMKNDDRLNAVFACLRRLIFDQLTGQTAAIQQNLSL
jgi:hypothetical protein